MAQIGKIQAINFTLEDLENLQKGLRNSLKNSDLLSEDFGTLNEKLNLLEEIINEEIQEQSNKEIQE